MRLVREGQGRVPDTVEVRHRVLKRRDGPDERGSGRGLQLAVLEEPRQVVGQEERDLVLVVTPAAPVLLNGAQREVFQLWEDLSRADFYEVIERRKGQIKLNVLPSLTMLKNKFHYSRHFEI